jgi:hypothetical protein
MNTIAMVATRIQVPDDSIECNRKSKEKTADDHRPKPGNFDEHARPPEFAKHAALRSQIALRPTVQLASRGGERERSEHRDRAENEAQLQTPRLRSRAAGRWRPALQNRPSLQRESSKKSANACCPHWKPPHGEIEQHRRKEVQRKKRVSQHAV